MIEGRTLLLEAAGLRIAVCPEEGGALTGFAVRARAGWRELIFRSREPGRWRGGAPWLFPAVGRNYAAGQLRRLEAGSREPMGSWRHGGRTLPMPLHGFVMDKAWEAFDAGPSELACRYRSAPGTLRFYPFRFELTARYRLLPRGCRATLEVAASPRNRAPMPFSPGNHLALALPLARGGDWGSCRVRTPARSVLELSPQSLLTGRRRRASYARGVALARDPALSNLVLGGYPKDGCWLEVSDPGSLRVRVGQRELVEPGGRPRCDPRRFSFVLWSDETRTFLCPEPWYGAPNSLNEGKGLVSLAPGGRFAWRMEVTVAG